MSRSSLTNAPAPTDRMPGFNAATTAAITVSTAVTMALIVWVVRSRSGDHGAAWVVGRSSGITSYVLMTALTCLGLLLANPGRPRWRQPTWWIGAHVALAVFTLAFLAVHIVVLATDTFAGVGWLGALVPFGSHYRTLPVAVGVMAAYSGLLTWVTALGAGRWAGRIWWPIHKVAISTWLLAWIHGVLAGIDTPALWWLYVVSALLVAALVAVRHLSQPPTGSR